MTAPSVFALWKQAGGGTPAYDGAKYHDLLIEHGHLVGPGDPGYDEARRDLACGFQHRDDPREAYGRLVRETWVAWAQEQPPGNRKPSWLIPWTELDNGQREVDMRIGATVAAAAVAAERERIARLADRKRAVYCVACDGGPCDYTDELRHFADLIREEP